MHPNPRVNEIRSELILDCTAQHLEFEQKTGTEAAVQHAISSLIGAAQFLSMRLGDEKARETVGRLHASL